MRHRFSGGLSYPQYKKLWNHMLLCRGPSLIRTISSAAETLPACAIPKTTSKSIHSQFEEGISSSSTCATDPWARIFDNIPKRFPDCRRTRLSSSYFHPNLRLRSGNVSNLPFFTPNNPKRRSYSTNASPPEKGEWDAFFDNIETNPKPVTSKGSNEQPYASRGERRSSMSTVELSAFDDMFNMIFEAVNTSHPLETSFTSSRNGYADDSKAASLLSKKEDSEGPDISHRSPEAALSSKRPLPVLPPAPATGALSSDFGRMRRQSNRMHRTSEMDDDIDRLKEQVELCHTDFDILLWAKTHLFPKPDSQIPPPPTYSHLLAHLMHIFRTKYGNPPTALALFAYAKRLSTASYVFGCTTPAYNEMLFAVWEIDKDVRGVENILVEMRANAVAVDGKTRAFVERVRREVGEQVLREREESGVEPMLIGGEEDPWQVLARVEELVQEKPRRTVQHQENSKGGRLEARKKHWREEWKQEKQQIGEEDRLTLR